MNPVFDQLIESLDVRATHDLLSHEQTIESNVKRMQELFLNTGQLVDPLIVDRTTNVVLDGNHRLYVLSMMGCPLAVCQTVDYMNPEIRVGTWLPTVAEPMHKLLEGKSIRQEIASTAAATEALNSSTAPFVATQWVRGQAANQSNMVLEAGHYELASIVGAQHRILEALGDVLWEYIPDDLTDSYLARGYTVLLRRPFTKEEIVQGAKERKPFPPKSTRHLIPNRIIRLNMHLEWLHGAREQALESMRRMLEMRVYEGSVRRYFEPVIVIY